MARLGKFSCFFNLFFLAAWIYLDVSCSAQEVVRYVSEKAPNGFAEVVGVIEKEGPAGIQIKAKGNVVIVPALDVVAVQYRHPQISPLEFRAASDRLAQAIQAVPEQKMERFKLALDAAGKIQTLAGSNINVVRYGGWRVAMAEIAFARAEGKEVKVLSLMNQAMTSMKGGWEEIPACRMLVDQQALMGFSQLATLEKWGKISGLPNELAQKVSSRFQLGRIREGKGKLVIDELGSLPAQSPEQVLLVALARCVSGAFDINQLNAVRKALAGAGKKVPGQLPNPAFISGCLVCLGEFLEQQKQSQEALWEFVRVENQFSSEKPDLAVALYHLGILYDTQAKNPRRAEECAARLKSREFAGAVYQEKWLDRTKNP